MFNRKQYAAEWIRQWRATHRLEALAKARKYDAHRRRKKTRRIYMRKYCKLYYHKTRETQLQSAKIRYRKNPGLFKKRAKFWALNNPIRSRQNALLRRHRRIARLKNALGKPFTRIQWLGKVSILHWRCLYCKRKLTMRTLEMDHLIPIMRGGKHELKNLAPACRRCNARKGTMTKKEFLKYFF
jgi:5-methylcytosine-specific restriction endonuclease McrA